MVANTDSGFGPLGRPGMTSDGLSHATAHRPKRAVRRRVLGKRLAGDDDPCRIVGFNRGKTVVLGKQQTMGIHFVSRLRAGCRACGFTLVELMITLVVAAILLMIAVPSFQHLILSNRLTTAANGLVDAINTARMDAIKLNATTQFCGNTTTTNNTDALGAACGTAAGAVYSLPQSAATAAEVRATPPGIASPVQIANAGVSAVRFSGQGYGYDPNGGSGTPLTNNTLAVICTSQLASNNLRVVSITAGSIVATASSTGTCP